MNHGKFHIHKVWISRFHPEFSENPTSVMCAAQEVLDDPYEKLAECGWFFWIYPRGLFNVALDKLESI